MARRRYSRKRQLKIKQHLKDIDFRTRKERSLDWERDFNYWLKDLRSRPESLYAQIQLPILETVIDDLHSDAESVIEWLIELHDEHQTASVEDTAVRTLASSCLWYLDTDYKP